MTGRIVRSRRLSRHLSLPFISSSGSRRNRWDPSSGGLTTSLAGLIVAVFGPVLGSIADRSGRRKPWIAGFTLICVAASAGLWWVLPSREYTVLGLALVIIGTLGSEGASMAVGMDEQGVLGFGIAMNIMAGTGAVGFAWLDDWLGSKKTIVLALIGLIVPSVLILFVSSSGWFWALGLTLGIFVGPTQAASRTYMGRIVPPELSNEMFGLYALSGKMTSFLGPLLVGGLSYQLGDRIGMAVIPALLLAGLIVLVWRPRTSGTTSLSG